MLSRTVMLRFSLLLAVLTLLPAVPAASGPEPNAVVRAFVPPSLLSPRAARAATGPKYIRDDPTGGDCTQIGTWDSVTKTCTLTTDVVFSGDGGIEAVGIVIDSNDVTVDGDGHTLEGDNDILEQDLFVNGSGVYLNGKSNVTVRNLTVKQFNNGIFLFSSSGNTLSDNTASLNKVGIYLVWSAGNTLTSNTASSNYDYGISLGWSTGNTLTSNTASSSVLDGMSLAYSGHNTLSDNTMSTNLRNFSVYGDSDAHFDNSIDTSNQVEGKRIYFIQDASAQTFDASTNAGVFYCIRCTGVTIRDLSVSGNRYGLYLYKTKNSRIENVDAFRNDYGINLEYSTGNTLSGNSVTANGRGIYVAGSAGNRLTGNDVSSALVGIALYFSTDNTLTDNTVSTSTGGLYLYKSDNNEVYRNSLLFNLPQARAEYSFGNLFNRPAPEGGNYWSDLICTDFNFDGFCDRPYEFEGGRDDAPWVAPKAWLAFDLLR
ncbi:MAG: right-handed parallel beta-helix repeat-containing protein [Acidobacteria bacterium]|nr:right-handed parallel beta-helix repeat-containing protein [Acidobacteriota bacterium]